VVGGWETWRRIGVGRGECEVLFGAIGVNGNDVRDIFVLTRYRSDLWKTWGGTEVGAWETWRKTGVGRRECEVLFGAIGDNGNDVRVIFVSIRYRIELCKKWGWREVGGWETWRRTGVGHGDSVRCCLGRLGTMGMMLGGGRQE